ncbi:MAG: PilN domain-containing protein [Hyphomicrobiales bacterium]|nr:PilN domain-containing protein [Hyphomicrobiales bacterium]
MILSLLRRCAAWWLSEIRLALPASVKAWGERRSQRLTLTFDDDGDGVAEIGGRRLASFAQGVVLGEETPLKAAVRRVSEVEATVPERLTLRRDITMPIAAARRLEQALPYHIPRISPFGASDVYASYCVISENRTAGTASVAVTLVPKANLKALETAIPEALRGRGSLRWRLSDAGRERLPTTTLKPSALSRRLNALAAVAITALTLCLLLQPYLRRQHALHTLQTEIAALQPQARIATNLRSEAEALLAAADFLEAERRRSPSPLHVLKALTEGLDDTTWLTDYRSDDKAVIIGGLAPDASALLSRVRSLKGVAEATFAGPILRDDALSRDRFTLSIKVVGNR